jgi:hypothetical protein
MTEEGTPPPPDGPLQFDRVEIDQSGGAAPPSEGLACKACGTGIRTEYFSWNGAPLCDTCKTTLETARRAAKRWSTFGRAVAFGIGATIAGAILYYAVLAITKLEIGLIAIVIGYMVGYSVRRGSRGWGGRRFQVLALVLTYYAVGLAYFPIVIQSARESAATKAATASSGAKRSVSPAVTSVDAAAEPPAPQRVGALAAIAGVGVILAFCAALPVLSVIGSFPSGLISAAIIGFGMRQAWRMTAPLPIEVTGPYKLGAPPVAS